MSVKPAAQGYKIDDSFFSNNYVSPREEDVEYEEASDSDPKDSAVVSPREDEV